MNLFNESQYLKDTRSDSAGLAHTFGLDFTPAPGWNLGFTLSNGELTNTAGGNVDRRAVSVSGGRTSPDTDWQSKLEWREDSGAEQREQWVSTNRLTHKINESWRIAARLNYADTDDQLNPLAGAKFIEGNVGFAYRPWDNQRWGVFGRYTYLYDLATLGQLGGAEYDQKSQILSFEGVYKLDQHWEFAGKLARTSSVRDMLPESSSNRWQASASSQWPSSACALKTKCSSNWKLCSSSRVSSSQPVRLGNCSSAAMRCGAPASVNSITPTGVSRRRPISSTCSPSG